MASHSSVLAWRIPGTGEPGGLPSVASHRVGHDWSDLAAAAVAVNVGNLIFGSSTFSIYIPYNNSLHIWMKRVIVRNWLTKLERLRSRMIYQWPAQDLGMLVVWFSLSAKASETGEKMMRMRSIKAENGCPSSVIRHRGPNLSFFHLFAVLRPLIDWMMPTHTGDTN